jgi:hypothetical protein
MQAATSARGKDTPPLPGFRLSGFPAFRLAEHYLTIPTT